AEPAAAQLDAPRPRQAQLDAGALQGHQVLRLDRRRCEAVAQLVAERAQVARGAGGDDAPVHIDLCRLEGDERGWQVGVDWDVEAQRLQRLLPFSRGGFGYSLVDHLAVELEADRGDVPRLLVTEQVAGAADV